MLVLLASAGDTGSAGDVGFCWYRWFCWFRPVLPMMLVVSGLLPMMRAVSGFAADACAGTAGDTGCGCSDNIVKTI